MGTYASPNLHQSPNVNAEELRYACRLRTAPVPWPSMRRLSGDSFNAKALGSSLM